MLLPGLKGNAALRAALARHTVIAVVYANQLQNLAEAVRKKRKRRPSLHLLHDYVRAHTAKATQQKIEELG